MLNYNGVYMELQVTSMLVPYELLVIELINISN